MKILGKILHYLLPTIALVFFLLFYFIYTDSGNKTAHSLMSYYASKKSGLDIEVKHLNLKEYPYITATLLVEEVYHIDIDGYVKNKNLELHYTLNSDRLKSDICNFKDDIDVEGNIRGWRKNISVTGKGRAMDGSIDYTFKKIKYAFRDIKLQLKDVNSTKLLSLLDQKALFHGKTNALLEFDIIEKEHKVGRVTYDVNDKNFYNLDTHAHAVVDVKDNQHTFTMDLNASDTIIHINNGSYDLNRRYASASYTLDSPDTSKLKKLLGGKYKGSFQTKGEITYENKQISINGISADLGGDLYFDYDGDTIKFILTNLSFEKFMQRLDIKPILHANITGTAIYDIKKKEMKLNTELKQSKLLASSLTKSIKKKFNLDLEAEDFDQSSFELHYKDKHVVTSKFILANNNTYLKLKNTKINASHNTIDTSIDIKTPKHQLSGKLFARIDNIGKDEFKDIYLTYEGTVEKYYHLNIDGLVNENFINMDYTLSASRLPSHKCTIVDDINITGHLNGSFERLHVLSKGIAMEGNVSLQAVKRKEHFEDISLSLKNIHILKLFTLLGLPNFPSGKANIDANFSYFSEEKKIGNVNYTLQKGYYASLPLYIDAHATIDKNIVSYRAIAKLSTADINVDKGSYDLSNNTSNANYTLSTKDLLPLEPLIGKYKGSFSARGKLHYKDTIQVRGLSPSFGGMVDFLYKNSMLYIDIDKASSFHIMRLLGYPNILDATVKGSINYDYNEKKLLLHTNLINTKFIASDLVQTVFEKSGVNMLKENFTNTKLHAMYVNKILTGNMIMKSPQSHVYLNNVRIDKNYNQVSGLFDLKMQNQAFSGKIYGDLNHPKIDLNMQKLMRYQMDKQMDSVMGENNRKMMDAMPMGKTAKDMASEVGGGFLDMFF